MDTGYTFEKLVQAYFDCRKHKRNSTSALRFEMNLEHNLSELHEQLQDGSYRPGRSICFVITHPKPREVWAADFRDRIVHHLIYNHISERFIRSFIFDSCACIPGRGTLFAVDRLNAKVRSITQNWSHPAFYLKMDISNFFVSIDKPTLWLRLAPKITEPWWRHMTAMALFHDPRNGVLMQSNKHLLSLVPAHKRLMNAPDNTGLPIGNLSSQFFANVLLDGLDQYTKYQIKARHYVRYVDDFILLHESPDWLNSAKTQIEAYLPRLKLSPNPKKTILQPIDRGVDFVGYVIKPWHREIRRRSVNTALNRIETLPQDEVYQTANSYLGLMRQAKGHRDRAMIANAARKRGHCVDAALTKAYRRPA
jgi:hypothetical protein